jgi:hypothetical protein
VTTPEDPLRNINVCVRCGVRFDEDEAADERFVHTYDCLAAPPVEPEECPLCDGTGWALAKGNGWVSAPRPLDDGAGTGTETNCPLEGVHEHPFRGPHRFREWEPGT